MLYPYTLLRQGDLLTLLFAIFAMHYIGLRFIRGQPTLRAWGVRLAAVVLVLFGLLRLLETPQPTANDILSAVIIGAFGAGLTIGPTWIVLAIAGFLAEQLFKLRCDFQRRVSRMLNAFQQRVRESERERRQQEAQRERQRLVPQQECHRKELEQQREALEAEKRKRDSLRLAAELELEFALDQEHQERMRKLVDKFADESLPVEEYEKRIQAVRDSVTRNANRSRSYRSITEVVQEFDQRLADLDQLELTEEEKESLQALLMMERQQVLQRLMQQ